VFLPKSPGGALLIVFLWHWSSRGSLVKVTDLRPANLGSTPAGTHMNHWWQQERHPAEIALVPQKKFGLHW